MIPELTLREYAILVYVGTHGTTTYRELAEGVGLRSTQTAWTHVRKLIRRGLLLKDGTKNRTIRLARTVAVSSSGHLYRVREVRDGDSTTMAT